MLALTLLSCLNAVQAASVDSVQFMPPQILQESGSTGARSDLQFAQVETAGGATPSESRQGATQAGPPSNPTDEIASTGVSPADPGDGRPDTEANYSGRMFLRQSESIPWRLGVATAVITATGIANWDWGSSPFHFKSEGWFGRNTSNLGMDKLGHAYSSYVLTEFFTDGIDASGGSARTKSYTAGILAMGLMTYIEVFDGYSKEHGFSPEDLTVDLAGTLFSIARRSIPGMREKVDFRLLYKPSSSTFKSLSCFPRPHCDKDGETDRSPITDYTGQRYLLAFKLAGFGRLRATPLRLLEVHAGYYARGFTKEEEDRGDPLRRRLFAGVGLNVGELLFPRRRSSFARAARSVLEWVQLPYTAIHSD